MKLYIVNMKKPNSISTAYELSKQKKNKINKHTGAKATYVDKNELQGLYADLMRM